jgi:hypothetical protein
MNRLDTTQFEAPQASTRVATGMIWGTFLVFGAASVLAAVWGISSAFNPTDQTFSVLSRLPPSLLIVDGWALLVVVVRRNAATPLRVPFKTPLILGIVHTVAGVACQHFVTFDVLYDLVWVDDRVGHYEVRWVIGAGLTLLSLVSFLLAAFETRLVRWVLLSEFTSAGTRAEVPAVEAPDVELGTEHVYEAQILLNNLGYDVSPISGELNASTMDSLKQFQDSVNLPAVGKLTAKSMIELRNVWREKEKESSSVRAVSEHAVRRTGSRIAGLFKRS